MKRIEWRERKRGEAKTRRKKKRRGKREGGNGRELKGESEWEADEK